MYRTLEITPSVVDPILAWVKQDERARLVVDDDLNVHWINVAAFQFLEQADMFDVFQKRLVLHDVQWMYSVRTFIRSSGLKIATLCIPCPSRDDVLCTALRLGTDRPGQLTGLTLRCVTRPLPFDGAALETAFHLTSAERRVVETLLSGRTAEQAGAGLCISIGTVRAHIRHIYEKLNVGSREALFHKLLQYLPL